MEETINGRLELAGHMDYMEKPNTEKPITYKSLRVIEEIVNKYGDIEQHYSEAMNVQDVLEYVEGIEDKPDSKLYLNFSNYMTGGEVFMDIPPLDLLRKYQKTFMDKVRDAMWEDYSYIEEAEEIH